MENFFLENPPQSRPLAPCSLSNRDESKESQQAQQSQWKPWTYAKPSGQEGK